MNLPTREECLKMLDEYKLPAHIKRHIINVNKVAVFLAKKLKFKNIEIDVALVDCATLLHDLCRMCDIVAVDDRFGRISDDEKEKAYELRERFKGIDHADAAFLLLNGKYPEVAMLVKKHNFKAIDNGFSTWEEKICYYADKVVMHDKIVTLQQRLQEGARRYNIKRTAEEEFRQKKVKELEHEIFCATDINEKDLLRL